jgi:hypothetical protein
VAFLSVPESSPRSARWDWPPTGVWLAAAVVALLRALPFIRLAVLEPPSGTLPVRAGYVISDWLAYVAMARQGAGLLANPFTNDPQDGRIVLLLHQALGGLHAWLGLDPFLLLELARIPILAAFTWVAWRFTGAVLGERRLRVGAMFLLFFSGGVAYLVRWTAPYLPPALGGKLALDTATVYGWSTFEAAFNPLWLAGLTLALVSLRPLLQPGGPRDWRDLLVASGGLLATWLVHPYSGILVVAAASGAVVSSWVSSDPSAPGRMARTGCALAPPILAWGALAVWQRQDAAYRASSEAFFGAHGMPVFWYPVTLGAVGFFALRGLRSWVRERHPWHHGLAGWVGAVVLLHTSNVVNGYHFVFGLHVPLALLATAPIMAILAGGPAGGRRTAVRAVTVAALIGSTVATTVADTQEVSKHYLARPYADLLTRMSSLPTGTVLCSADLGGFVPAYGPHRVYAGHWFMTPRHDEREALFRALTSDPSRFDELRGFIARERFRYVVVPGQVAKRLATELRLPPGAVEWFGDLALVRMY